MQKKDSLKSALEWIIAHLESLQKKTFDAGIKMWPKASRKNRQLPPPEGGGL